MNTYEAYLNHPAGQFGVAKNRAVRYECDDAGTKLNFAVMSKLVSCARSSASAVVFEECLDEEVILDEIRADYESRHDA